ncbi:LuxR C-terminal-related transcriptional regulator [Streptomyces sp. NPDC056069]|uniref:helix-turn-helix transcriptional regulator n=1 Tax=Streptomyces sp. NPDC056069 TaxID=3345702 RepID=UPI0035DD2850
MSGLIGAGVTDYSLRSAGLIRWPFVGRKKQLNAFAETLVGGRSRGFVVWGPAGVGKSRLAEECLARAVRAGFRGARATASDAAAALPLGVFVHLIPESIAFSDPVAGLAHMAGGSKTRSPRTLLWLDDLHSVAAKALCLGDSVQSVRLPELNQAEIRQLLKAMLGGPVDRRAVQQLHAGSGGNALHLSELVRRAVDTGSLVREGELWRLSAASLSSPPALTELLESRLAAAGPRARPVLELLALCGPLLLDEAECVTTPAELSKLEKSGLIHRTEYRRRSAVALVHPLYGEVLLKQTSALRRRNLLLGQADRTESLSSQGQGDLLRIAIWRLHASGTVDSDLLIQAATLSHQAHDFAQAASLLEAMPAARHTTSTRVLLGNALIELGRWQSAEEVLSTANMHVLDDHERLEVALARITSLFWLGQQNESTLEVVHSTLPQVTSSSGRRTLRIVEGYVRALSGRPDLGLPLLEEHMEPDADASHDLSTWLRGAFVKTLALTALGRTAEAMTWGERAYDTHLRAYEDQRLVPHPATQLSHQALAEWGRLTEGIAAGERTFSALAVAAGAGVPRVWIALFTGRAEWQSGHLVAARRWFSEALDCAREINQLRAVRLTLSYQAATAAVLGDVSSAESAPAEPCADLMPGWLSGEERLGEAWMLAAGGQTAQARRVLSEAADSARRGHFFTSEALLLTDLARLGGAREAVGRLSELAEFCDGPFTSARARFAAALAADDPGGLMTVADHFDDLGADLLAAEAASAAATMLARLGEARMAAAARSRAAAVSGRCDGARTPLLATTDATAVLTGREREIAQLAAEGLASKAIAEMLNLSVRTVENHLQRAFVKLGITNRKDLQKVL